MELTLFQTRRPGALAQVLMIDVVLAGDNAVVIGLAAARVPVELRKKVILWGLVAAVVLRIVHGGGRGAAAADHRPDAGGRHPAVVGVLAHVARHFRRTRHMHAPEIEASASLKRAILQILVADVSMSLDNVLAVAGAARDHLDVLVIGLLMSVALMGAAAN